MSDRVGNSAGYMPRDSYQRFFDLVILTLGHVAFLPILVILWIVVSASIWIGDRGPVLYSQTRLGKGGRPFKMLKFRTMKVNAEADTGAIWAKQNDERITGIGRLLRRYRIDEMPQVLNMWKGDMSLVGPRPERPELVAEFEKTIPGFRKRLRVRPGFAGLAQVRGRYSTRPRDKLRYDNLYIERMNPFLDLKLCLASFWTVIRGFPH